MKEIRVLVTGVSSSNSLTIIKGLRKQTTTRFTIVGTDVYPKQLSTGAHFCDLFFEVPLAVDKSFTDKLLDVCLDNKIDVLIPVIDEEFKYVSARQYEFERENIKVMLPDKNVLEICRSKIKVNEFLEEEGFPVLNIYLDPVLVTDYPIVRKPIEGRGSRKVTVIHNQGQLDNTQDGNDVLYQKYINGPEYTVDTLSDLHAKIIVAIPRKRLVVRDGKCIKGETVLNKNVEQSAVSICEKLGLTGPACLQCKTDDDGIPYFFDINPRVGSATILTVHAGVNIPYLAIKNLLGMEVFGSEIKFKHNVVMLRYLDEIIIK